MGNEMQTLGKRGRKGPAGWTRSGRYIRKEEDMRLGAHSFVGQEEGLTMD